MWTTQRVHTFQPIALLPHLETPFLTNCRPYLQWPATTSPTSWVALSRNCGVLLRRGFPGSTSGTTQFDMSMARSDRSIRKHQGRNQGPDPRCSHDCRSMRGLKVRIAITDARTVALTGGGMFSHPPDRHSRSRPKTRALPIRPPMPRHHTAAPRNHAQAHPRTPVAGDGQSLSARFFLDLPEGLSIGWSPFGVFARSYWESGQRERNFA